MLGTPGGDSPPVAGQGRGKVMRKSQRRVYAVEATEVSRTVLSEPKRRSKKPKVGREGREPPCEAAEVEGRCGSSKPGRSCSLAIVVIVMTRTVRDGPAR